MKRKILTILFVVATVFCLAMGLAACQTGAAGGTDGTYYLYTGDNLDKSQYIILKGNNWSDDDEAGGTYTLNGSSIVFYADVFGSNEEMFSGTLVDGVLKISVFGAPMTYCKEGVTPSGDNQGNTDNPQKPDKREFTVTYNANGGTFSDGGEILTKKAEEGSTLTAPDSPMRTASAFGGWSVNKNGGDLWKFATDTVTGDITLYAVWQERSAEIISVDGATIDEKAMTVNMLVNRSTDSVSLSNKIVCSSDSVWKLYYDKLGQTEIPTKIAAGKSGALSDGDNVFYIVVTSSNGAQVNVYELTVHRSYAVNVNYFDNKSALIKTDYAYTGYEYNIDYMPNITGYTFNKWKTQNGGTAQTSFIPYAPVNLYADCTANTYTATLDVNGGNAISNTEVTLTYDKSFSLVKPTRTGYTFLGWYYGNTPITNATGASLENWTYTSDRDVYAKWSVNDYTLTLNKDLSAGGSVEGAGEYTYGNKVTITARTNSGYTWLGWYDKNNKQVTTSLNYSFNMGLATTYTAKWIACPVTVERESYGGTVSGLERTVVGEQTTITAESYRGYTWVGWYNGETELTKDLNYTFTMTSTPVTYTAKWEVLNELNDFIFTSTKTTLTVTGIKDKTVTEIVVPDYVTSIDLGAFSGCSNLESITIPFVGNRKTATTASSSTLFGYIFGTSSYTGGTVVGQYYSSGKYTPYYIPKSLKSVTVTGGNILYGAFYDCSGLTSITIGDSVTSIGEYAFSGCSSLTIYCEVTSKPSGWDSDWNNSNCPVVWDCENNEVADDGNTYTIIDGIKYALKDGIAMVSRQPKSISGKIIIPEKVTYKIVEYGVTSIGDWAFDCCGSLTSISIPDSVTSIGNSAFFGCGSLTSITIGDSVTSIGEYAFYNCRGLTSITFKGTKEQWNAIKKYTDWDKNTGNYTIHCTDGDINK